MLPDTVGKKTFVGGDVTKAAAAVTELKNLPLSPSAADCTTGTAVKSAKSLSDKEFKAAGDTLQQSATTPGVPAQSAKASTKNAKFLGPVLQTPDGL